MREPIPPVSTWDKKYGWRFANLVLCVTTSKAYRVRVKGYIVAGMNCLAGHPLGNGYGGEG